MKLKMTLRLFLLTIMLALLWSCRTDDFAASQSESKRNNNDFFKHTKKESAYARSGVDYVDILESYNKEKDFLSQMPDQNGMPIWDKMRVMDTEDATGLIIPLSFDNETLSSVLFATLDNRNTVTGIKDYDNNLLEKIIYDAKLDKDFRQGILTSYLVTDHYTFGTIEFTNIPYDLYTGVKHGNDNLRLSFNGYIKGESHNGNVEKLMISTTCLNIYHCKNNKPPDKCDGCSLCVTKTCGTEYIFTDDDNQFPTLPGNPGTGGGGGNPGTPTQQPPKDPCTLSVQAFYRLNTGCLGTGGGLDDEELLPPKTNCETLKQLNEQEKVNNAISDLKTKTIGKQEFAYEIERNGTTFTTNLRTGTEFGTMVATGGYIKGQAHNHPARGMSIPSIGDVIWLRDCKTKVAPLSANAFNIIVCYDPANPTQTNEDIVYSIMVDDYDTLNTKIDELLNRSDLQGLTDPQKYDKLNYEMGLAFSDVQFNSSGMEKKFIEKYTSFGISLYKQDKTTKNWDKLSIENNTVNKIPCP